MMGKRCNPFGPNEFVQRWLADVHHNDKSSIVGAATVHDLDDGVKLSKREKMHPGTKEEKTFRDRRNVVHKLPSEANLSRGRPMHTDSRRRKREIERFRSPSTLSSVSSPSRHEKSESHDKIELKNRMLSREEKNIQHHHEWHHGLEARDDFSDFSLSDASYVDAPYADRILRSPAPEREGPSAKYARRPRYKTKAYKYEYKGHVETQKSSAKDISKHRSKRSRRKKTGATLGHDFKAPNIDQERLTLKPNSGQGIFGKGKASSPVPRRGLPDLSFAEMTFLNKRTPPEEVSLHKQKEKKPPKKKDKSLTERVSEFFARESIKRSSLGRISNENHHYREPSVLTMQTKSTAQSSPAKPGARRSLSLVPENGRNLLHETLMDIENGPAQPGWIADSETPALNHSQQTLAQPVRNPPARKGAASHYSVSVIPSLTHSKHECRILDEKRRPEPALAVCLHDEPPAPFLRECSLSNSSLERFTKRTLLGHEQNPWHFGRPPSAQTNFFSLDDLKGLARVSEFDARFEDYHAGGDHTFRCHWCSHNSTGEFCTHQVQSRLNDATASRCETHIPQTQRFNEKLLDKSLLNGDLVGSTEAPKAMHSLNEFQSLQATFTRNPSQLIPSQLPTLPCPLPEQASWALTGGPGKSSFGASRSFDQNHGNLRLDDKHPILYDINGSLPPTTQLSRELQEAPSEDVSDQQRLHVQPFPSTWRQEFDIPRVPRPGKHVLLDHNNGHEMPSCSPIAEVNTYSMRRYENRESQDYKPGLEYPSNLNDGFLVKEVDATEGLDDFEFDENMQVVGDLPSENEINDLCVEDLEKPNSIVPAVQKRDMDWRSSRYLHGGSIVVEHTFTGFSRPHVLY